MFSCCPPGLTVMTVCGTLRHSEKSRWLRSTVHTEVQMKDRSRNRKGRTQMTCC